MQGSVYRRIVYFISQLGIPHTFITMSYQYKFQDDDLTKIKGSVKYVLESCYMVVKLICYKLIAIGLLVLPYYKISEACLILELNFSSQANIFLCTDRAFSERWWSMVLRLRSVDTAFSVLLSVLECRKVSPSRSSMKLVFFLFFK